jgi:TRAP-type uncharacterized transport system fused permease subunit
LETVRKFNADSLIDLIGAALTVFTLSIIIIGPVLGYGRSLAIFLGVSLILTFYIYKGGTSPFWSKFNFVDAIWMILALVTMGYLIFNNAHIISRIEYVTEITQLEYILGVLTIIVTLEATRRAIGLPMVLVCLFLLAYLWFGKYLTGYFGHGGFGLDWIIDTMYLTTRGIFGSPLWVVVTLAYTFILYGLCLEEMGVLQTFLDFANKIFGKADWGFSQDRHRQRCSDGYGQRAPHVNHLPHRFPNYTQDDRGGLSQSNRRSHRCCSRYRCPADAADAGGCSLRSRPVHGDTLY